MDVHGYISDNWIIKWKKKFPKRGDFSRWLQQKFIDDMNADMSTEELEKEIELKQIEMTEIKIQINKLKKGLIKVENEEKNKKEMRKLTKNQKKQLEKKQKVLQNEKKIQRLSDWIVENSNNLIKKPEAFGLVKQFSQLKRGENYLIEFLEKQGIFYKDQILVKDIISQKVNVV